MRPCSSSPKRCHSVPLQHLHHNELRLISRRSFQPRHDLLIIDDLMSIDFYQHLVPDSGPVVIVVTTNQLSIARRFRDSWIRLDGVTLAESRQYMSDSLSSERVDEAGTAAIHRVLGGNPSTLCVASTLLERQHAMTLQQFADGVQKDPGIDDHLMQNRNTGMHATLTRVGASLSVEAQAAFGALSLFQHVPFSYAWARVATGCKDERMLRTVISELLQHFLLRAFDESVPECHASLQLPAHVLLAARAYLEGSEQPVILRLMHHMAMRAKSMRDTLDWQELRHEQSTWSHLLAQLARREADGKGDHRGYVELMLALTPGLQSESFPHAWDWLEQARSIAHSHQWQPEEACLRSAITD